jgi:hypothetical protein
LCLVVYYKFTDVSEVLAAFIIRAIALMMEAATTQKTAIFILAAVRTSNLTKIKFFAPAYNRTAFMRPVAIHFTG